MQACQDHANGRVFTSLNEATAAAAGILDRFGDDRVFIAEMINEMGKPACCPAAGLARSLMLTAYRRLLTKKTR